MAIFTMYVVVGSIFFAPFHFILFRYEYLRCGGRVSGSLGIQTEAKKVFVEKWRMEAQ